MFVANKCVSDYPFNKLMFKALMYLVFGFSITFLHFKAAAADIKIGVVDSRQSGEYSIFPAVQLAVDKINRNGGLLGKKISIEYYIDHCDPKLAVAIAGKLASQYVSLVVGHMCDVGAFAASARYAEEGVTFFSTGARDPKFTERRNGPTIFRMSGNWNSFNRTATSYLEQYRRNNRTSNIRYIGKTYGYVHQFIKRYGGSSYNYSKLESEDLVVISTSSRRSAFSAINKLLSRHQKPTIFLTEDLISPDIGAIADRGNMKIVAVAPLGPNKFRANSAKLDRSGTRIITRNIYGLYAFSAFQVWVEAVKRARSFDSRHVAKAINNGRFSTVLAEDFNFRSGEPQIRFFHVGKLKSP